MLKYFRLSTDRVVVRDFHISDADKMYALNADPDVIRYTGDESFSSIGEAATFIQNYNHYEKYGFGRWTVITKATNKYIGWCGLKQHDEGFVDIGFRFFKKEWGKGYATEVAKACLEYGFNTLGLTEIIGRAAKENVASIRVLEKIGMKYWKEDICEGIEEAVYYKITKKDIAEIL